MSLFVPPPHNGMPLNPFSRGPSSRALPYAEAIVPGGVIHMETHSIQTFLLEMARSSILIFSALFPIVNPLGNSPIFLGLTRDYSTHSRTLLARKIAVNGFFLLIASMVIGTHILSFFGISIPVVQVGGGLLVISTGWGMLNRREEAVHKANSRHDLTAQDLSKRAFYPLTLPLTVGPGSISVAITVGANEHPYFRPDLIPILASLLGAALIAVSIYFCYRFAERLAEFLGETVMSVILRLSSFILLCIGVQIVWNGVLALLKVSDLKVL